MSPEEVTRVMDAIAEITEVVVGFRAKLIGEGIPEDIANEMTFEFMRMLVKGVK